MTLQGGRVSGVELHEEAARPRVDWNFLTGELERKWGMVKDRIAAAEDRPWAEQTELRDALARMEYDMTRLLSRM